jgi:hypothetical protein
MKIFGRNNEPDPITIPDDTTTAPPAPTTTTTEPTGSILRPTGDIPPSDQPADDLAARLAEVTAENRALRLTLDTREVARTRLADPDDLLRYTDTTALVDADGRPDHGKIAAATERLLTERPYLAATPRTYGSADQGARFGLASAPMTRDEVAAADPRLVADLARAGRLAHLGFEGENGHRLP